MWKIASTNRKIILFRSRSMETLAMNEYFRPHQNSNPRSTADIHGLMLLFLDSMIMIVLLVILVNCRAYIFVCIQFIVVLIRGLKDSLCAVGFFSVTPQKSSNLEYIFDAWNNTSQNLTEMLLWSEVHQICSLWILKTSESQNPSISIVFRNSPLIGLELVVRRLKKDKVYPLTRLWGRLRWPSHFACLSTYLSPSIFPFLASRGRNAYGRSQWSDV